MLFSTAYIFLTGLFLFLF